MPLISLSAEEKAAALQAASPDLKYHLSEVGVPVDVQAALYHKGFTTLRLFSGIDESRLEVRAALAVEIGLKHDDNTQARQSVAVLLSAWESSRSQLVAEDRMRVESKLGQTHRIAQTSELSAMRQAVEAQVGQLQDDEVPAKSLIATKLEQIETLELKAEDLREVLCADDTEVDVFSGIIEHGSGNLKIKPGKATIPMPASPEELPQTPPPRFGMADVWNKAQEPVVDLIKIGGCLSPFFGSCCRQACGWLANPVEWSHPLPYLEACAVL